MNVPWAAVEPTRGTYNDTWLAQLVDLVNTAGGHGIMVLLDFHQDALSQLYCGTGLPDWVVAVENSFPSPLAPSFNFTSMQRKAGRQGDRETGKQREGEKDRVEEKETC